MNLNYTCICYYCGEIYQSNRSTSKYCCTRHNSLYHLNGFQINCNVLNRNGTFSDYSVLFLELYSRDLKKGDWNWGYSYDELVNELAYDGPLPEGDEFIVVGLFVLAKMAGEMGKKDFYFLKPFQLLTKTEKARGTILRGAFRKKEE